MAVLTDQARRAIYIRCSRSRTSVRSRSFWGSVQSCSATSGSDSATQLGLRHTADELIGTDLHQPHLGGVAAFIDRAANLAKVVPLRPVWSLPRAAVLLDLPLGQLLGSDGRRGHPDDLRLGS